VAGSAFVPPGAHAHATAQHALLPVPATFHRTLRESGGPAADGGQSVEYVQREREPANNPVADQEERGGARVPRGQPRGERRAGSVSAERIDRALVRQERGVPAIPRAGAGGADGSQHEGYADGRTGGGGW